MFGDIFNQSVPGQLYHINLEGGKTVLIEPAEDLADMVFYYWLIQVGDEGVCLNVIPDGALDLVLSPWIADFSAVYLPAIEYFEIPLDGPACYVGISFEPEAAQQLFDASLQQLDALIPGTETIGELNLSGLMSDIQNITDIKHIKHIFDRELISLKHQPSRRLGQSAYRHFIEEIDSDSIRKIAAKVGISDRQLRRTIHDISVLPPKKVQRIVRLQQLLHELFNSQSLLSEDGFYDQSHRIQEMKKLTGMTYGELRKMAEIYNTLG